MGLAPRRNGRGTPDLAAPPRVAAFGHKRGARGKTTGASLMAPRFPVYSMTVQTKTPGHSVGVTTTNRLQDGRAAWLIGGISDRR
jgi:hypothetical protein